MRLLQSGLDTVECAYYLREGLGCGFDFADLAAKRETMRAAKKRDPVVVVIGGKEFMLGRGGSQSGYPLVLNNVGGTRFKVIGGYQSATPMMLAMERGETEGAFTSWNTIKTTKQEWLRNKTINILVQFTETRHKELPDVPAMVELGVTDEDKRVLALYASGATVGRSIIAPPGVPADRVAALRAGFDAMLEDPAFLGEIERTQAEFRLTRNLDQF